MAFLMWVLRVAREGLENAPNHSPCSPGLLLCLTHHHRLAVGESQAFLCAETGSLGKGFDPILGFLAAQPGMTRNSCPNSIGTGVRLSRESAIDRPQGSRTVSDLEIAVSVDPAAFVHDLDLHVFGEHEGMRGHALHQEDIRANGAAFAHDGFSAHDRGP
jgi:hypothetical protein